MFISIHPLFVLFFIGAFLSGVGGFAIALLGAVLLHEGSHALLASRFGVHTKKLKLLPCGAKIDIDVNFLPKREKILILLAGSFGNIIVALVSGSFLWVVPGWFSQVEIFIWANAAVAIMNLLPIYPLDGGKVLYLMSDKKLPKKIIVTVSTALFGGLVAHFCLISFNPFMIAFGTVMILTIHLDIKSTIFSSKFQTGGGKKKGRILEIAVTSNATLFELYQQVSRTYFTKFIVIDVANKIIYENQLQEFLVQYDAYVPLGTIFPRT